MDDNEGGNEYGRGRSGRRDFGERGNREMHKATCAECKQECEVPFVPAEGRPVYCRDCYKNRKRY
ncbi:MAG: CxxC-x17-CxxC domain-containing protein [Candidatus Micrarchaeia archaeon]